jgi:hypothetical protein
MNDYTCCTDNYELTAHYVQIIQLTAHYAHIMHLAVHYVHIIMN